MSAELPALESTGKTDKTNTYSMWSNKQLITSLLIVGTIAGCASEKQYEIDIDGLLESTSEYQKEIIRDGAVSEAEFEQSIYAWWQCVKDVGAQPEEVKKDSRGYLGFEIVVNSSTSEESERISAKVDDCRNEYITAVGPVYAHQKVIPVDEKEMMLPEVTDCLRANGLTIPDDDDYDSVIQTVAAADQNAYDMIDECLTSYPKFFELPSGYEVGGS